jgi:hypothetical protein
MAPKSTSAASRPRRREPAKRRLPRPEPVNRVKEFFAYPDEYVPQHIFGALGT